MRWRRAWQVGALLLLAACGAGGEGGSDVVDISGPHFGDGSFSVDTMGDAAAGDDTSGDTGDGDDASGDGDGAVGGGDGGALDGGDGGGGSGIVAAKLDAPPTIALCGDGALAVTVKNALGQTSAMPADAAFVVEINGKPASVGFDPTSGAAAVGAVALWQGSDGIQRLVGVRPGGAKVAVRVAGVLSNSVDVIVTWPTAPGLVACVPDAKGATTAKQVIDADGWVRLSGATIGPGGLDATLRFGAELAAGDVAVVGGATSTLVSAAFSDLAGAKYQGAQGFIFVDQTNKGRYRGTALVRTTSLKPMALAFVVDRDGLFGVDALDEAATTVATSDAPTPTTGLHHSRVSVLPGAPGSGKAHIVWREIENILKARLRRVDVDLVSGAVDAATPALIDDLNAYDTTPDVPAAALGAVALTWPASHGVLVWEGRDGKGNSKPHRLHAMRVDANLTATSPPLALSSDGCSGACRPRLFSLAAGRALAVWSPPQGGVRAVRIKGLLVDGALATVEDAPVIIAASGGAADAAVHAGAVVITWFDPDLGPVWRTYQDKPSGGLGAVAPAQAFGLMSPQAPPVALTAATLNATPSLLFVAGWVDLLPSLLQRSRRIGVDGTALGQIVEWSAPKVDSVVVRAGKPGQVTFLGQQASGGLVVYKRTYGSFADDGKALGAAHTVLTKSDPVITPAWHYDAATDVWLVAWSGWQKSAAVAFRRFR